MILAPASVIIVDLHVVQVQLLSAMIMLSLAILSTTPSSILFPAFTVAVNDGRRSMLHLRDAPLSDSATVR